jgi:hypothetical protein
VKTLLDLGSGVTLEWTYHEPEGRVGYILDHPKAENESGRCGGAGWVNPEYEPTRPHWTISSEDPLTMSPSFLCHCGFHGFVTNGKWVPA